MGVRTRRRVEREELGEPVGDLHRGPGATLRPAPACEAEELPLVIDEVPMLALLAAHARGDSWFLGAGELRVKEMRPPRRASPRASDRWGDTRRSRVTIS